MAIQTVTIDAKAKVKIFCEKKSKFIGLDSFATLYYSLHGILKNSGDLIRWVKTNSINENFLIVMPLTTIFFYNYGTTSLNLQYDDEIVDEITIDFDTGCN